MGSVEEGPILTKYEQSVAELNTDSVNVAIVGNKSKKAGENGEIKLYKRRFLIMGIFCLYSMSSAFQWIEYAIITNIILDYYEGSTELAIAWTSLIYMLSYIPLMFVATWMLDNWGLRRTLLFGATFNAVGALLKIPSVSPNLFALSFAGQTIAACAQSFILEIPPKIASLWFGPKEVSTATAVGVFGNQLGVALGFLIPPILVPNSPDMDEVAAGLRVLFISSAAVCTLVVFLIFFVIKDTPPLPPSRARLASTVAESENQAAHSSLSNYKRSIVSLMKNVPFVLLVVTYGINTGTYYAIGTLLNPILLAYHEDAERQIGEIGLTMVVAGLGGSVICGYFLDKTKLYRLTTVGIYFLSMVFMFVFTFTLNVKLLWLDYVTIGLLGFFMTGYLPIGFEFGAELTFPESEATSSGLLNVSAQVFGITFTLIAQEMLAGMGTFSANIFMCVALFVGTILTALIKSDLRRQRAELAEKEEMKTSHDPIPLLTNVPETNTNNSNNRVTSPTMTSPNMMSEMGDADDERLVRMTSTSSCYSTGGY